MFHKILLVCLIGSVLCTQYTPIPTTYDGFGDGLEVGFIVEPFYDPLCPTSFETNEAFEEIIEDYELSPATGFYMHYHVINLPYHPNSILAGRSIKVVEYLQGNQAAYKALNLFWESIDVFQGSSTENLSMEEVVEMMAELICDNFDISQEVFFKLYNSSDDMMAQIMTNDYGASRGVSGTATVFINGVYVTNGMEYNYDEWVEVFEEIGILPSASGADLIMGSPYMS